MTQDVVDELSKEGAQSQLNQSLLDHAKGLIKMSRMKMAQHYSDWDLQDQVYRGVRFLDEKDLKASLKQEPVKMVVPHTFAQVMTFASFLFLLYRQNRTFFELVPTGDEDYGTKQEDCETVLESQLRQNQWNTVLFQHLLDVGRFGPAIMDCSWTRKITRAYVTPEPVMENFNGVQYESRGGSEWRDFVKYEGNLIRPVSPYRFFPDTRFPLTEFQRGEFCGAEEEYSMTSLYDLQKAGEVAGVQYIQPLPNDWSKLRGAETRTAMTFNNERNFLISPQKSQGTAIVTKLQVWIVPSKYKFGDNDKKLGPEEFPILHHLWYANDNRVIRVEPAGWWHNEFSWSMAHFTPDMHHTVNSGLADLIYRLQDVITWHINSRITDVRRNLRGRNVVDITGIDPSSLDGDGDIYLRKSASKSGVDRWIKPLDVRDVTASHMTDAELLGKLMQVVTGVNDNAMGQYNSGRRSAQEARVVTAGAAGRMKLHGHLIWDQGIAPLGKKMLSNVRQSLPLDQFERIVGLNGKDADPQELQARFDAFKGTPEEVICGDDYFVFDSTLSSEKGFMAQSLSELLTVIVQSDPAAGQRMAQGVDPVKVVEEIQYLRGAGNIKRFQYTPEEQQAIIAQQKQAFELEKEKAKVRPSISLSGKLTPEQEAEAATDALGRPQAKGQPQQTPSSNGSRK